MRIIAPAKSMDETNREFNPFAVPSVASIESVGLQEGESFLISDRLILCSSPVELPRVCIVNGDTVGLKPRMQRFQTLKTSSTISIIFLAAGLLTLLSLSLSNSATLNWITMPVIYVALLFIPGLLLFVALFGQHELRATWYVGERYRRRNRIKQWSVRVICVAAACLLGALITSNQRQFDPMTIIKFAGMGLLISFSINTEHRLQFKGRRHGLFALGGHSRQFAETVQAMELGRIIR